MADFPTDYVPPKKVREFKYSIRQNLEDHMRLLWWAQNRGNDDTRCRAAAARHAIHAFLDAEGVPSAEEIIRARANGGDRHRALEEFLDQENVPSADDIQDNHHSA